DRTLSPRPYLHPVTTLSGTPVTDAMPADHLWHLGVSVAVQDVNGTNLWGGRTYVRDAGYVWRADHGRIKRVSAAGDGRFLDEELEWIGHNGSALLRERRTTSVSPAGPGAWELTVGFELSPAGDIPVQLGSPGSNGREKGGYGGFFWRLPAVARPEVFTATAAGEDMVHGSVSPWLAFSESFGEKGAEATLVFAAEDKDPWFVRCEGYPGVGRSLAWDRPLTVSPGVPVCRSIRVLVADGRLDPVRVEELLAAGRVDA
ncbi:MAG TPA: PmoA family protein, partial [Arthrobacter sp.]|nr:PmoA family protein [Arthrobacter sp.]